MCVLFLLLFWKLFDIFSIEHENEMETITTPYQFNQVKNKLTKKNFNRTMKMCKIVKKRKRLNFENEKCSKTLIV